MSLRLLSAVIARWEELDGYAVAHGMPDLRDLPLGRLCNFAYWKFTENGDQQFIEKFRARLWMPPKGVVPDARSPWAPQNETAGLAALSAQVGKRPAIKKKPTPDSSLV